MLATRSYENQSRPAEPEPPALRDRTRHWTCEGHAFAGADGKRQAALDSGVPRAVARPVAALDQIVAVEDRVNGAFSGKLDVAIEPAQSRIALVVTLLTPRAVSLLYRLAVYALRIYDYRWSRTLVDNGQVASSPAPCILAENDKTRVKSSVIIFYSEELLRQKAVARPRSFDCHMSKPFHGLVQQCDW
jgi:hypothetical protein